MDYQQIDELFHMICIQLLSIHIAYLLDKGTLRTSPYLYKQRFLNMLADMLVHHPQPFYDFIRATLSTFFLHAYVIYPNSFFMAAPHSSISRSVPVLILHQFLSGSNGRPTQMLCFFMRSATSATSIPVLTNTKLVCDGI